MTFEHEVPDTELRQHLVDHGVADALLGDIGSLAGLRLLHTTIHLALVAADREPHPLTPPRRTRWGGPDA